MFTKQQAGNQKGYIIYQKTIIWHYVPDSFYTFLKILYY